jgi:hypothetical protein
MSTRLGMGDGRCLTSYDSSKLVNDYIMMKNGIAYQDNFKYRMYLQNGGVDALRLPLRNAACGAPLPFAKNT